MIQTACFSHAARLFLNSRCAFSFWRQLYSPHILELSVVRCNVRWCHVVFGNLIALCVLKQKTKKHENTVVIVAFPIGCVHHSVQEPKSNLQVESSFRTDKMNTFWWTLVKMLYNCNYSTYPSETKPLYSQKVVLLKATNSAIFTEHVTSDWTFWQPLVFSSDVWMFLDHMVTRDGNW